MSSNRRTTLLIVLLIVVAGAAAFALLRPSHREQAGGASSASSAAPAEPAAPAASATPAAPAAPVAALPAPALAPQPDLVMLASSALNGCRRPMPPAEPPDGDRATRAQMLASQDNARAFNAATDTYLACLDQAARDFQGQYGRGLSVANWRQIQTLQTQLHNDATDADHAVAERFNRQLHIFLARGRS